MNNLQQAFLRGFQKEANDFTTFLANNPRASGAILGGLGGAGAGALIAGKGKRLQGAGLGGLAGAGLGTAAGQLYTVANEATKAQIAKAQQELHSKINIQGSTITPRDVAKTIYGNRTQEAIDAAKSYKEQNDVSTEQVLENLNLPITISPTETKSVAGGGEIFAQFDPQTNTAKLPASSSKLPISYADMIQHEILGHGTQDRGQAEMLRRFGMSGRPPSVKMMEALTPPGLWEGGMGKLTANGQLPPASEIPYWVTLQRKIEVEPRLAAIKHKYFSDTGELISTPALAEKALEAWQKNPKGMESNQLLDMYKRLEPENQKKFLDYMIKTLPGLVQNKQSLNGTFA